MPELRVDRARARRVVRYQAGSLPMTAVPGSGGTEPEPDPYRYTDYWASGDYGYVRRGSANVVNQGVGDGYQTLPESIALPDVPDALALRLTIDIWEIFGFYNVWDRQEARLLINGDVWKDWWPYESQSVLPDDAAWPPPAGTATVQLRASYHPPDGVENWMDWRWSDVNILRYVIAIMTPNT